MTERELLELAAKAAGFNICSYQHGKANCYGLDGKHNFHWNPLNDDGDALRLAVKLGLAVSVEFGMGSTAVLWGPPMGAVRETHSDDPYAATRRAIVLAAAEVGKEM